MGMAGRACTRWGDAHPTPCTPLLHPWRSEGAAWEPPASLARPRLSLRGAWNLGRLLLSDSKQPMDVLCLHVPAGQVAALKAAAAGARGGGAGADCAGSAWRARL